MAGWEIIYIDETDSTNRWLRERQWDDRTDKALVVWSDFQTAGRGCGTNSWESERGKNLLFSIRFRPEGVTAVEQFRISMAISLAICETLEQHIGDLAIKWPNDIYWRNGKLGGILIENRLKGILICDSIIGVGLNVNQQVFRSDAPNPVSLWQIHGQETDRRQLLEDILSRLEPWLQRDMKPAYMSRLYRRKGFYPYADKVGVFMAEIIDVERDGHLILCDEHGQNRRYAFKEVTFV
jgi:BirA family biotin operon repressor/biotin-[acetyl-CoA-carboxylase] ligase